MSSAPGSWREALSQRAFARVDVAPLVWARVVFGLLMAVEIARYFAHGWIRQYYIEPTFHFTYPGFDWVRPMPAAGMYALFGGLGIASALVAVGLFHRWAALFFAVGFSYVFLLDQTHYLNHAYLICLFSFLMACVPAASAGSLDARRAGRSGETAPAWARWLLGAQIAVVYVYGGIAKLDGDWLSGAPAESLLEGWDVMTLLGRSAAGRLAFVWAGLLFDLLIVPALLWRRTRLAATLAAAAFHLTNARLFQIGIFPWMMLALTPLFYPAAWTRRALSRLRILAPAAPAEEPARVADEAPVEASAREPAGATAREPAEAPRPWILAALGVYLAWQLLFPLRHWLYPGQVNWTEEGHDFSWHMKLRVKRGEVRFVAHDPDTGESWDIDPRAHVTARQLRVMAMRPEMIRQLANELRRRNIASGHPNVQIHALALVSLNGRPRRLLVDPAVDLGRVRHTWAPASWIMPLDDSNPAAAPGTPLEED